MMSYFADNEMSGIAPALGAGERTVKRELQTARLYREECLARKGIERL